MSKRRDADVVIIGGGITGCAAAYHLAKRGKRVTVVEKGETAGEASGRNTGGVRVQGRNPVEYPFMLECIKMWEGLEKELGADIGYVSGGNLLYVENEADMKEIERGARLAKEYGVDSYAISPEECRELVPGLNAPVLGALYSPTDGHADPARSTKAFEMAARELGVEVLTNCAALDIDTSDGQVTSVRTDMGRIDAPYIVNAAGVWANHVGRKGRPSVPGTDNAADAGDNGAGLQENHAFRAGSELGVQAGAGRRVHLHPGIQPLPGLRRDSGHI